MGAFNQPVIMQKQPSQWRGVLPQLLTTAALLKMKSSMAGDVAKAEMDFKREQNRLDRINTLAAAKMKQKGRNVPSAVKSYEMTQYGSLVPDKRGTPEYKQDYEKYRRVMANLDTPSKTSYQKNFEQMKSEGYEGSFSDFILMDKAIAAAQKDPRVNDPFKELTALDLWPEYANVFGIQQESPAYSFGEKQFQRPESLGEEPSGEQLSPGASFDWSKEFSEKETLLEQLKNTGAESGAYRDKDTGNVYYWNGESVYKVRKPIVGQ